MVALIRVVDVLNVQLKLLGGDWLLLAWLLLLYLLLLVYLLLLYLLLLVYLLLLYLLLLVYLLLLYLLLLDVVVCSGLR